MKDPAPIDPTYGDPVVRALSDALGSGDWQTASRVLHGAGPGSRAQAIRYGADDAEAAMATVRRWMAEWPDDPMGLLVGGSIGISWAWAARGRGMAEAVEADAWQVFFDRLKEADLLLHQAARAVPSDALPWALMITSARGLQIPLEEQTARFDESHRRDPWNYPATMAMLQNLCAKWSGSHEQMYAFARYAASESVEGSPSAAALPMARIEEAISLGRELGLEQGIQQAFRSPSTVNEIVSAAEHSIFHPAFVADGAGLEAANVFLAAFFFSDRSVEADRTLRILQGRYGSVPFQYIGDPGRMCRKVEVMTARKLGSALTRPPR